MTDHNKRDFISRLDQQADKQGLPQGDLLSPPNPQSTNAALEVCRSWSTDEITKATSRYFNHSSLENLAEVSLGIGNSVLALCNLARVLGIPLERVLDRILVAQDVSSQKSTVAFVERQAVWDCLDRARGEEEFKKRKNGGDNWTADQVYENFNRQGKE